MDSSLNQLLNAMTPITLKRWSKELGETEFCTYKDTILESSPNRPTFIDGCYAKYKEGIFCAWVKDNIPYFSWQGQEFLIDPKMQIEWQSKIGYRKFSAKFTNDHKVEFKYYTFAHNAIEQILSIIYFDDDWGLVNDLPSFVHSCHSSNDFSRLLGYANSI